MLSILPHVARAADLSSCDHNASPLTCRLDVALHILTWVAIVLGVLLVLVVGAALGFYRSKRSSRAGDEDL